MLSTRRRLPSISSSRAFLSPFFTFFRSSVFSSLEIRGRGCHAVCQGLNFRGVFENEAVIVDTPRDGCIVVLQKACHLVLHVTVTDMSATAQDKHHHTNGGDNGWNNIRGVCHAKIKPNNTHNSNTTAQQSEGIGLTEIPCSVFFELLSAHGYHPFCGELSLCHRRFSIAKSIAKVKKPLVDYGIVLVEGW